VDILLSESEDSSLIGQKHWSLAVHGPVIDDRGKAAVVSVLASSKSKLELHYEPDLLELSVNNIRLPVDSFVDYLPEIVDGPIVLEASTLGFVEILLCCRSLRAMGVKDFDIVYVEPRKYRSPRSSQLLHRRDFELSSEVPGYRAIPGNAMMMDRRTRKGVFFLGYEDSRLRRAFEDLQSVIASQTSVVFGIPAFRAGWEIDSIANNISVIREQNIRGGIHYCGAENPAAVVDLLSSIHKGLTTGEGLYIAPIGTKPHGVGTALFASTIPGIGVIYDHPKRTPDRTSELGRWHIYSVNDFTVTSQ